MSLPIAAGITQFWTSKTETEAAKLYETHQAPHRQHIIAGLHCIPGIKSLYEVGCGSGPNLKLIRDTYPDMLLKGADPSEAYVDYARKILGIPIDLAGLPETATGFDVLLSVFTFAYVPAQIVRDTITKTDATYVIIFEPGAYVAPFPEAGMCQAPGMVPYWVHDYPELIDQAGYRVIWRWPVMPHHQGLNSLIVAERHPKRSL